MSVSLMVCDSAGDPPIGVWLLVLYKTKLHHTDLVILTLTQVSELVSKLQIQPQLWAQADQMPF